jgi:hypothetical protein
MIDVRHIEKTREAIQRSLDALAPKCGYHCNDPAMVSVDDLRQLCLTLKRADELLQQARDVRAPDDPSDHPEPIRKP